MKKSIEPNERLVKKEVRFLNVVLYPESRQSPQRYAELFAKVFDLKIAVNTFAEKKLKLSLMKLIRTFVMADLLILPIYKGRNGLTEN